MTSKIDQDGRGYARPPLDGMRVVDFSWVQAAPQASRYLADLGADVLKLEGFKSVDPMRRMAPYVGGIDGVNRVDFFHNLNAGKSSMAIDLKAPEASQIVHSLVRDADIVIESYAPGVIDRLGFGYEQLSRTNEQLIMVSASILGRTGPWSRGMAGLGTMGAALTGATDLVRWPDRKPTGVYGAWSDSVAPRFITMAILIALRQREATSTGCYLDIAQAEAALDFLRPAFYEFGLTGRSPEPVGGDLPTTGAPAGLFPCRGEDSWVAIDASAPDPWENLRRIIGGAAEDAKFDTIVGRLRARAELSEVVGAWTRPRTAQEVEDLLQSHGIPSHVVSRSSDLGTDPDLRSARHLRRVADPEMGEVTVEAPRYRLSRTPHVDTVRGPHLGEHSVKALADRVGMAESEIESLIDRQVIATCLKES